MVADYSVGVYGIGDIEREIEYLNDKNSDRNKILKELVKLKKIELTEKKPNIMFLYELLDFLKSLPLWDPNEVSFGSVLDVPTTPKACFVGPKWDGRIEMYRDCEHLCDIRREEGEVIPFDVYYYIRKISEVLKEFEEV